jgi:hypothetical protein
MNRYIEVVHAFDNAAECRHLAADPVAVAEAEETLKCHEAREVNRDKTLSAVRRRGWTGKPPPAVRSPRQRSPQGS